jgi:TetR/AcrR family transcriptional repressor of nem operon
VDRYVLAEQVEAFAGELQGYLRTNDVLQRRHLALGLLALMYGGISFARALRGTPLSDEMIRACRAFGRIVVRP